MEIYGADIYPMKAKKKPIVVNILLAVLFLGTVLTMAIGAFPASAFADNASSPTARR